MRRLLSSALVLGFCVALLAPSPALAGGKLKTAFACWKHNRSVDSDERLSVSELAVYQQSGKLPARVAPVAVLARKIERARVELQTMRGSVARTMSAASTASAYDAVVWSESALGALNAGTQHLFEASRYARAHGLAQPATIDKLARGALAQLEMMDGAMGRARLTYDSLYWGRTHADPYAVSSREGNRRALTQLAGGLR